MIELTKPTLILDKTVCLKNIEKMSCKAKDLNLQFRPHFKTHQSATIGDWFRDFGVKAITVSSVSMAEYFAKNGWDDITIAIPVNIHEIDQINQLASSIKINIVVENPDAIKFLNQQITNQLGVFIKTDTGYHRTGVSSSKTNFIDTLLEHLKGNKNLEFKGFLSHTGHTYTANSVHEIHSRHFDALLKMKKLKQRYQKKYPDLIISIGDTPSCSVCDNFDGVNEIRPGNFVFYDLMQYKLGVCSIEDIAVKVACPVISKHPSRNEVTIYGGAVHLSKESITNIDGKPMFGRIIVIKNDKKVLLDELSYVSKLSQEHGILKVSEKDLSLFNVGDFIEIIPVHSCLTANLMRKYLTTEDEEIGMMGC